MKREQMVVEWVTWLTDVRKVRGSTIDVYGRTLHQFIEFIGAHKFDDVDADMVERFMCRPRRSGESGSPATQNRDRVSISMFYKFANGRGWVSHNPMLDVGVPKVRNRQPKAVPDETWVKLWRSDLAREDRVWLGLACFAGLRRREIVSVAPRNFNLKHETIEHFERKGGGIYSVEYGQMARIIAENLPHLLPDPEGWLQDVAWLVEYRKERGGHVLVPFDRPCSPGERQRMSLTDDLIPSPAVINKKLETLLRRAGLNAKEFTPHALRHTCATNMMRCGIPVEIAADQLSHASIETTRRYLHTAGQLAQWRRRTPGAPLS